MLRGPPISVGGAWLRRNFTTSASDLGHSLGWLSLAQKVGMGALILLTVLPLLGCAATGPKVDGKTVAVAQARESPQSSLFRLRTRVWGEGEDVRLKGTVRQKGEPDGENHADIAVYAPDGGLITSASAPYRRSSANGVATMTFAAQLPGLRGRKIRLRIAPHEGRVSDGESCADNASLEREEK